MDEACRFHPNVKWWLKADGCDIVSGLEESLRHEWNGDIDCGTPEVEILYSLYRRRLEALDKMVSDTPLESRRQILVETLRQEHYTLLADITFIADCKNKLYYPGVHVCTHVGCVGLLVSIQHAPLMNVICSIEECQ